MAIHISGKDGLISEVKDSHVQFVPFKIHADCDAKITEYFNRYVKKKDNDVLSGSFRGYGLDGKKVNMPDGYRGIILHESLRPSTDKEDRKLYVINSFNSVTYWNWSKTPSRNDAFMQALDWIDIADALHSPVTEE